MSLFLEGASRRSPTTLPDRTSALRSVRRHPYVLRAESLIQATIGGLIGHNEAVADAVPELSFRYGCSDIDPDALLTVLSHTRGHTRPLDVAVLLHGLLIDESNWNYGRDPTSQRMERMFGWTPLCVRYNTGRHISENGEQMARLLHQLYESWGPRLGRVQVMGHSMGGLVARSTLAALERMDSPVLNHIERLFLFATPNNGAEIEVFGHVLEYGLGLIREIPRPYVQSALRGVFGAETLKEKLGIDPVERLIAALGYLPGRALKAAESFVAARSDGIRDVRYGYMLREEWIAAEQDGYALLANHRRPVRPPEGIDVFAVAGSLWPDVGAQPSRIRNDGVVTVASAAGFGGTVDDLRVVEQGHFRGDAAVDSPAGSWVSAGAASDAAVGGSLIPTCTARMQ